MGDKADFLIRASELFLNDDIKEASSLVKTNYPYLSKEKKERKFSDKQKLELFIRDGFVDRYSGKKLIFPGMLMAFNLLIPEVVPADGNWKMSSSHEMFWHQFPTYDHIVPVSRGGEDIITNCVTTSMTMNSAKAGFLLEEIEWKLYPAGNINDYDGLIQNFINIFNKYKIVQENEYCIKWYKMVI